MTEWWDVASNNLSNNYFLWREILFLFAGLFLAFQHNETLDTVLFGLETTLNLSYSWIMWQNSQPCLSYFLLSSTDKILKYEPFDNFGCN